MSTSYEIPGLDQFIVKLAKDYPGMVNRHLSVAMHQVVLTVRNAILPNVPVGVSGRLKNSIGSTVKDFGAGNIVGRVGSSMKSEAYPAVMEFGRKPGAGISAEGMESLTRWVHVKRISGVYSIKTKKRMGSKQTRESEDRQAAFAIARSIKAKGIKGRHFMEQGFNASKGTVDGYFKTALNRIVEELANGS